MVKKATVDEEEKSKKFTLGIVSDFLNKIRHLNSQLSLSDGKDFISVKEFLGNYILKHINLKDNQHRFSGQISELRV